LMSSFSCLRLSAPRSPLFPYTTLFRSGRCGDIGRRSNCAWDLVVPTHTGFHSDGTIDRGAALRKPEQREGERLFCRGNTGRNPRSEEHTSELQSRGHLVCRLLLEKKKT